MQIINAGRTQFRRFPAAAYRGAPDPGLNPVNVFNCKLMQLTAGALASSAFLQLAATPIPLLLFVHDMPAAIEAWSRYSNIRFTDAPIGETHDYPAKNYLEVCRQDGDVDAAPYPTVFTAASVAPTSTGPGQLLRALTTTNAVRVSGYATTIRLADLSLQAVGGGDATALVSVEFIGRSGVVDGPVSNGEPQAYEGANTNDPVTAAAFADRVAVILRESDYTQAMHDAGNVLTDVNGLVADIVGLHAIPGAG